MGFLPKGMLETMKEVRNWEPFLSLLILFQFPETSLVKIPAIKKTQTSVYKCPSGFLVKAEVTH